jgi:nicotinamide mononucleotide transporter
MNSIFDFFFGQYSTYTTTAIVLEIIAVVFGFLSVWYAKKNNILVYPAGMVSTAIFVYLLWKWQLLGDMMINGYYFIMSAYGWYVWTRKVDAAHYTPITKMTTKEKWISLFIFIATLIFVYLVYRYFNKWNSWTAYADTFTTGTFFVGMWLMARKKIENWFFWIIGNFVSIPLYFYKGLTLTTIQYLGFLIIAYYGYFAWKKNLNNTPALS